VLGIVDSAAHSRTAADQAAVNGGRVIVERVRNRFALNIQRLTCDR
jgi:hypothetical protein